MSKAFTRESDDVPERPAAPRPVAALPPGVKNLLTPGGALRLRAELQRLVDEEQKLRATPGKDTDAETKRVLQSHGHQIQQLQHALHTAVIAGPPAVPDDVVRFGATVTVRERGGAEVNYRIVGVDETDLEQNWVSWLSPVAKVLLHARVGQRIRLKLPLGEEELEILKISYE